LVQDLLSFCFFLSSWIHFRIYCSRFWTKFRMTL